MTAPGLQAIAKTCQEYLAEIGRLDLPARAEILGGVMENGLLRIALYDHVFYVSGKGIREALGEKVLPAIQVMISKYVLTCSLDSPLPLNNKLVTYREFKDAGPLTSYFTANTNKTLESAFTGKVDGLRQRAVQIGGKIIDSDIYDLSLRFFAFPRVPIFLNFNDQDELFPASCSILYYQSAAFYLDMECLAMTGTLLTGKLLANP